MSDLFSLADRVVAVIGAGAGIGAGVAEGAGAQGATVVCLDVDQANAEATAGRIRDRGGRASSAVVDVTSQASVDIALEEVVKGHGSLDGVVATPGINVRKPLLEYSDDEFDRVIGVNLKGSMHVIQSAGRRMKERGSGSIVLFSSIRSLVVEPGQGVYAATKAGIVQMVRAAAAELGPSGVRVNAVGPGVVETPLTAPIKSNPDWYEAYARKNILGRWAKPSEMAGATVFLLSDAASYVTGTIIFVDGGWTAVDGRFWPPGM